ncbi:MAG: hypothetical protein WC297_01280 [Candidatus Paceibacterota bacterium]|jgi:hypothetical protein
MNPRTVKQLLYFLLYVAILAVIIFLIYLWLIQPKSTCFDNRQNQNETGIDCGGPCQSCEIKTLKPLTAQKINFSQAQNKAIITFEITNSNQNFGADNFTYTIDFYNKDGAKINSLSNNSFIYAAEIKAIFEVDEKVNFSEINNASISFSNVHWVSKENFSQPSIELQNQKIVNEKPLKIEGTVINKNNFGINLKLIGFIYDHYGIQISASKTEIDNLGAKGQIDFQIVFPSDVLFNQKDSSQVFIEAKQ